MAGRIVALRRSGAGPNPGSKTRPWLVQTVLFLARRVYVLRFLDAHHLPDLSAGLFQLPNCWATQNPQRKRQDVVLTEHCPVAATQRNC